MPVLTISSQVFLMLTAVDVSSATTEELLFTVLISSSRIRSTQKEFYTRPMTDEKIREREKIQISSVLLKTSRRWLLSTAAIFLSPLLQLRKLYRLCTSATSVLLRIENGAAMSLGRTSTFLDIYFERDFKKGILTRGRGTGDSSDRLHHEAPSRSFRKNS